MNDNSLGFAILDIGTGFTLLNQSKYETIPYGTLTLTLINIDYKQFNKMIATVISQYFDKSFNPADTEALLNSLYSKISFYISYSSKGYMHTEQANMVTELIVTEILNMIEAEHFEITDINKCVPFIFSSSKAQDLIKKVLKRDTTDLTPLIKEANVFEINSQLLHMELPVYYLNTISEYLLLDLKMYLDSSPKTVKECDCCGRLYLPTRKSDKYCQLPRNDRKTCADIMHISPNDEYVKVRNKARDKQHKQIQYYKNKNKYDEKFLLNLYSDWSIDCGQKYNDFKSKEDIDGFKAWITKTKFTSKTIEDKWIKFKEA